MISETKNPTAAPLATALDPSAVRGLTRDDKHRLLSFAIFTVVLGILFLRPIIDLVRFALDKERQSYLLLVPAISAYLIWIKRRELDSRFTTSIAASLIPATLGIAASIVSYSSITWTHFSDRLSLQIF